MTLSGKRSYASKPGEVEKIRYGAGQKELEAKKQEEKSRREAKKKKAKENETN